MILTCPKCNKQYQIDESKVPEHMEWARCKACGERFPLQLKEEATTEAEELIQRKPQKTRKIAVSLSKGGVGKTTTAVNLAAGLAMANYKVLLVDTDTQGQCSFILGLKPKTGLTELVTKELGPEETIFKARERLWLLAGGRSLAGVKRFIDRMDFGGESTMTETLASIESSYDFVIIDTSPGWDAVTVNVLFYVDELLIPVSLEVMSVQGLIEYLKTVSIIQKHRTELDVKYLLPTFLDNRTKQSAIWIQKLKELYPDILCEPIRQNVTLAESPVHGKVIYEYAPGSNGAKDYKKLVRKVSNNYNLFL